MRIAMRLALAASAVIVIGVCWAGTSQAAEPQRHVVGAQEIQARIDLQLDQVAADRQAIKLMLQRPDVRQLAGAAGLDLQRANAAAGVLSGPALEQLAAQARAVDAGLTGGDSKVVISTTAIIIVLLLLILVAS